MNTAERQIARQIAMGLAICLPVTKADRELTCESCPYFKSCEESGYELAPVKLPRALIEDMRKLVNYDVS